MVYGTIVIHYEMQWYRGGRGEGGGVSVLQCFTGCCRRNCGLVFQSHSIIDTNIQGGYSLTKEEDDNEEEEEFDIKNETRKQQLSQTPGPCTREYQPSINENVEHAK
jgi:hypothetical protein